MDNQKQPGVDHLELRLKGRLDAYWSNHLDKALSDAIHADSHKIEGLENRLGNVIGSFQAANARPELC